METGRKPGRSQVEVEASVVMAESLSARESREQPTGGSRGAETAPEAATGAPSGTHEDSETEANPADRKTAREKIANLLWWSVPSSTDEEAKARTEQLLDDHRAEVLHEVTAWLVKKAREFHVSSRKREREQGDTCAVLASKIARGAVRPDNLRMLPNAGFFEPDHTYTREHHGETIRFFVEYVSASPDGRSRAAHGWRTRDWDTGWQPSDADDFEGWTDVTDAGEVSA